MRDSFPSLVFFSCFLTSLAFSTTQSLGGGLEDRLIKSLFEGDKHGVDDNLTKGANPDTWSEDGYPAIVIAALYNDYGSFLSLADAGADIQAQAIDGATTLSSAIVSRNLDIIHEALSRGISPDFVGTNNQARPLMLAIADGNLEAMISLLKAGADPFRRFGERLSPLAFSQEVQFFEGMSAIRRHNLTMDLQCLELNEGQFVKPEDRWCVGEVEEHPKSYSSYAYTYTDRPEDGLIFESHISSYTTVSAENELVVATNLRIGFELDNDHDENFVPNVVDLQVDTACHHKLVGFEFRFLGGNLKFRDIQFDIPIVYGKPPNLDTIEDILLKDCIIGGQDLEVLIQGENGDLVVGRFAIEKFKEILSKQLHGSNEYYDRIMPSYERLIQKNCIDDPVSNDMKHCRKLVLEWDRFDELVFGLKR